jgi:ABC-type uncharacterized transport system substrate-binding protein
MILALAPCQAFAHQHVFVTVKSEVVVNSDGNVTAIDHHWTFDDMYSSFVTVGLGKDGQPASAEELLPIAKINVDELEQFRYFTLAKAGGAPPMPNRSTTA